MNAGTRMDVSATETVVDDEELGRSENLTHRWRSTSSFATTSGNDGSRNTNGRTTNRGRPGPSGRMSSSCPITSACESAIPVSSRVSLQAVAKRSPSPDSRRPPGNAICPDQGSSRRAALLINRMSGASAPELTRTAATAASPSPTSSSNRGE